MVSLKNTLIELSKRVGVDYIIEESNNKDWTIYKLANGFAFALRQWSGKLTHYTAINGLYGYKDEYDLPKNDDGAPFFKQIDYLDYQMRIGNGFTISAYSNSSRNTGQNTSNCTILALATASGTQYSWVNLQIIGKWK